MKKFTGSSPWQKNNKFATEMYLIPFKPISFIFSTHSGCCKCVNYQLTDQLINQNTYLCTPN